MNRQKKRPDKESQSDSGFINESSVEESFIETSIQNGNDKVQLAELNNRLANYIDYVRKNEKEKELLKTFEEISHVPKTQIDNLRELYEKELVSFREALEHQSNELAEMTVKHDKMCADNCNLQSELDSKKSEIGELTEKSVQSEQLLLEAQSRITVFETEQKIHQKEREQYGKCREQLEREVLMRTAAENACLTLKEKMRFDENVFNKELGALMTTNRNTLRQMAIFKDEFMQNPLMNELNKSREKFMRELNELTDKFNTYFVERLKESTDNVLKAVDQASTNQMTKNELIKENNQLKVDMELLSTMHMKLEEQLKGEQKKESDEIKRLSKIIDDLFKQNCDNLENLMKRYMNLIDPLGEKITFDSELGHYKRMIEGEEKRTKRKFPTQTQSPLTKKPRLSDNSQTGCTTM